MSELEKLQYQLGEIYKSAHFLARKTYNTKAIQIIKLCNEMAEEYRKLEEEAETE